MLIASEVPLSWQCKQQCMYAGINHLAHLQRLDTPLPHPNPIITPQIFVTQKQIKFGDRTEHSITYMCTCYVGLKNSWTLNMRDLCSLETNGLRLWRPERREGAIEALRV